jgi:hypothetical protein
MRISQRKVLLAASAVMLMAATAAPEAKAASIILPTTGAGGGGNPDTNYKLVSAPSGSPTTALDIANANVAAGWVTVTTGPLWVSPVNPATNSSLPTGFANGTYTPYDYQLVVPASTLPAGTYTFSLTFAADDTTGLRVNGTSVTLAGSGTPGNENYGALTTDTFTATIGSSGGTFDFLVLNTGNPPQTTTLDGPTGLLVSAFSATAVPEPSSITIAGLGAIGVIGGYSLRRRKAKGA